MVLELNATGQAASHIGPKESTVLVTVSLALVATKILFSWRME